MKIFNKKLSKKEKFCHFKVYAVFFLFLIISLNQCVANSSHSDSYDAQSEYDEGLAYYLKSTFEGHYKGLKKFKSSVSSKPDLIIGYAMISLAYSRLGQYFFQKDNKEKAYRYYHKALRYATYSLKRKPDLSKGYAALALYARQFKEKKEVIRLAKKAIQLNPQEYEAYALLGDSYNPAFFGSRQSKQSIEYYKKSLAIAPYFLPARYNLALIFFSNKDYKKCIVHLNMAIQANPSIQQFYYYLSLSYKEDNKYSKALFAIQKGIELSAENPFYYDLKGQIYFNMNMPKEAILAYKSALNLNADIPQFFVNLGIVYNHSDKHTVARNLFVKAVELDPLYDLPHYRLAILYDKAQKYRQAIKEYIIFLRLTHTKSLYKKVKQRVEYLKKRLDQN